MSLQNEELTEQKQPPVVFYKKGVLKSFAKFTGKHLCQSLFFYKVTGMANNSETDLKKKRINKTKPKESINNVTCS